MGDVRLIQLGEVSHLESQSVYHCIAECFTAESPDTVVLLTPREPYVSVGYHQDVEARIDLARCRDLGVPVIRRRLGGGAVLLNRDQLFYQCIFHRERAPAQVAALFDRFLQAPVGALKRLGLPATLVPPNEIEVGGRRIAGTGAGQIGEAAVVVGNLLIDFPAETMTDLWKVPSDDFRSIARSGLDRYVTTLVAELGSRPATEQLEQLLIEAYQKSLGRNLLPGTLSDRERARLPAVERRLTSADWQSRNGTLRNPVLKISARVSVRQEEVCLNSSEHRVVARFADGTVDEVLFDPPLEELAAALRGWDPAAGEKEEILRAAPQLDPDHEFFVSLRKWAGEDVN